MFYPRTISPAPILLKKDFSFAEAERKADDTTKEGSSASDTSVRAVDLNEKAGSSPMASARSGDEIGKQKTALATAGRSVDAEAKSQNELDAEARNVDEVDKDGQSGPKGSERNQDFVSQHFHQDRVDWSGGRPPYELR